MTAETAKQAEAPIKGAQAKPKAATAAKAPDNAPASKPGRFLLTADAFLDGKLWRKGETVTYGGKPSKAMTRVEG